MPGWVDVVVQLRELQSEELMQFEDSLASNAVTRLVSAGFSPERDRTKAILSPAAKHIDVYHGWGLHPLAHIETDVGQWHHDLECLSPQFIGEVGLDKRCLDKLSWQGQITRAQIGIDFAAEFDLPLLWHSVQATQRSVELIKDASRRGVRGIWHSFYGSVETARQLVDLGWKLGVGPSLLKPSAHRLRETLRAIPVCNLLLESDWPQPHGTYCLKLVGETLATLTGVSVEDLQSQLEENFFDLIAKVKPS